MAVSVAAFVPLLRPCELRKTDMKKTSPSPNVLNKQPACLPLLAAWALLSAASASQAAPPVTAKVTYVGTYGDGRTYVGLDTPILEPGCNLPRFDIPSNHPQTKSWMAVALASAASGKSVTVATNGCFAGSIPTMTQGVDTYFHLLN
jgi:hypothetical protein